MHPGFKKLTVLASTQLRTCKAQQLANILWAFATLDFIPIPQFLESLAEEAIQKRNGFNPQNVANMLVSNIDNLTCNAIKSRVLLVGLDRLASRKPGLFSWAPCSNQTL